MWVYSNYNNYIIMDKKTWKIILLIAITVNIGLSQIDKKEKPILSPIVKSLIVPGWGQYDLDNRTRGNIFISTEIIGLALSTFCMVQSNSAEDTYLALAAEHAGVTTDGKDYQYWVDIGNYNSIDDYNDEHLRWREFDNIYQLNDKWNWKWDADKNRDKFEDHRIKSDKYTLATKFIIGGIVLNHIISAIDALYLQNVSLNEKVTVQAYLDPHMQSVQYSFSFSLK